MSLQKSYASTKSTKRTRNNNSEVFYSLAEEEKSSIQFERGAMKRVSSDVKINLKTDRSVYLETRYCSRPQSKYNFPEATSWRYGWFH